VMPLSRGSVDLMQIYMYDAAIDSNDGVAGIMII
jgi:hypothetical protein